ncbi:unnamed protein product [Bursaphelenchus okinawaensis]|uniref:Cytoplasmic polyadenylation element-binding protein ZZ domain-containing protein n=1 Tax=Bursaphelenchus okinawaensis TaxID=465554 RepID=A0A811JQS1_9BILA|nr:unnamed protein product [Bursaphelenchus okinawaensis]CAG9078354.1 unnamed protein product [Bursaphelenchus okinawaensis]
MQENTDSPGFRSVLQASKRSICMPSPKPQSVLVDYNILRPLNRSAPSEPKKVKFTPLESISDRFGYIKPKDDKNQNPYSISALPYPTSYPAATPSGERNENAPKPLPYRTVGNEKVFDHRLLEDRCVVLVPDHERIYGLSLLGQSRPLLNTNPELKYLLEEVNPRKRKRQHQKYSAKVVLGNAFDVTDEEIWESLKKFNIARKIERNRASEGFCSIFLKNSDNVEAFLEKCEPQEFNFSYTLENGQILSVYPWCNEDTSYTTDENWPMSTRYTVFIGCLPRLCTASYLYNFLKRRHRFFDLLHVRIDCDPSLYPRGAARAVFRTEESYRRACSLGVIKVKWFRETNRIEFKSFIYKGFACESCSADVKTKFCPDNDCLRYYCDACWGKNHENKLYHEPVRGAYRDVPYITKHFEEVKAFHAQRKLEEDQRKANGSVSSASVTDSTALRNNGTDSKLSDFNVPISKTNGINGIASKIRSLNDVVLKSNSTVLKTNGTFLKTHGTFF